MGGEGGGVGGADTSAGDGVMSDEAWRKGLRSWPGELLALGSEFSSRQSSGAPRSCQQRAPVRIHRQQPVGMPRPIPQDLRRAATQRYEEEGLAMSPNGAYPGNLRGSIGCAVIRTHVCVAETSTTDSLASARSERAMVVLTDLTLNHLGFVEW